jgi:hypothetical protein
MYDELVQYGQGVQKRIITNYNSIRAMSVEEMAEFLRMVGGCGPYHDQNYCNRRPHCSEDCWLDWLKQEASE